MRSLHRALKVFAVLIGIAISACPVFTQTLVPDDLQEGQWGLHNSGQNGGVPDVDIDAPEAWAVRSETPEIVVAVISTGVDLEHPDLQDNLWVNPDEIPGNGLDDDFSRYIDDVHGADFVSRDGDPSDLRAEGTHLAGIIGAVGNNDLGVTGVSWSIRIMPLRVVDIDGTNRRVIDALFYAADNGADIILLPRGDYDSRFWGFNTMQYITEAMEGRLLVVPVGDEAMEWTEAELKNFPLLKPQDYSIRVTAIDRMGALWPQANRAQGLADIAAPGVDILSTTPAIATDFMNGLGIDPEYAALSGTAQAAAHVAGALALLQVERPELPAYQRKAQLLAAADRFETLESDVVDGVRLNAARPLAEDHNAEINLPPTVSILEHARMVDLLETVTLESVFTDDLLQSPPGNWTFRWEQVAGPANPEGGEFLADLLTPTSADLQFSCAHFGFYTFRLQVNDGYSFGSAETSVYVRLDPNINPGLDLHWKFDGSFEDSSGNGHDAVVAGGDPGFVDIPVLGECASLARGDALAAELFTGGAPIWSVAAWVRSERHESLQIRLENKFKIWFSGRPYLTLDQDGGMPTMLSGPGAGAPVGTWTHLGVTCDGEFLHWWINGRLEQSNPLSNMGTVVANLVLAPGDSRLLVEFPETVPFFPYVPIEDLRFHVGYSMTEADFAAIVDPIIAAETPPELDTIPTWLVDGPGDYQLFSNLFDDGFPRESPIIQWTITESTGNATLSNAAVEEPVFKILDCGSWKLTLNVDDGWHTVTGETTVECHAREYDTQINFQSDHLAFKEMHLHPTLPYLYCLDKKGAIYRYDYEKREMTFLLQPDLEAFSFDIDPNGDFLLVTSFERGLESGLWKVYLDDLSIENIPYPKHLPNQHGYQTYRIGISRAGKAFFSPLLYELDLATDNIRLRYDMGESIPWGNQSYYPRIETSLDRSAIFFEGLAVIDADADRVYDFDGPINYEPMEYAINADGSQVVTLIDPFSSNTPRVLSLNTPDFQNPVIIRQPYYHSPTFHPTEPVLFTESWWGLHAIDLEQLRPAFDLPIEIPSDYTQLSERRLRIHPDGSRAFLFQTRYFYDIQLPSRAEFKSIDAIQDYASVSLDGPATELPGVLDNDRYNGVGEPPEMQAELLLGPRGAAHFALYSDGSFEYEPAPGFQGLDRFLYRCSGGGLEDNAIAFVEVTGPDQPGFMFPIEYVNEVGIVDAVLDDQRNILYVSMDDEQIRRLDLENKRLLPPLGPVSAACMLDISPDGRYLYGVSIHKPIFGGAHCLVNTETGFTQPIPAKAFMAGAEKGFFLDNDTVKLTNGGHLFHINGMYWTIDPAEEGLNVLWSTRARNFGSLLGFDMDTDDIVRQDAGSLAIERFPSLLTGQDRRLFANADGTQWASTRSLFNHVATPLRTNTWEAHWAFHSDKTMPVIARRAGSFDMLLFDPETGDAINEFTSHYTNPYTGDDIEREPGMTLFVTANGRLTIHPVKDGVLVVPIPDQTAQPKPRPVPDLYFMEPGASLEVDAANGLCANDKSLPEPELFKVIVDAEAEARGLIVEPDGAFSYTPSTGGGGSFAYRIESPGGVTEECLFRIVERPQGEGVLYTLPLAGHSGFVFNDPRNLLHWVDITGGLYSMDLDTGRITLELDANVPLSSVETSLDGSTCYCISGELYPGKGSLIEHNLDTGMTRRVPLSGETPENMLNVGNRLAIMADGTCIAGSQRLDLQTGSLGEIIAPLSRLTTRKGNILRSNDRRVFTIHDQVDSCSWVDGVIRTHIGRLVDAGDAGLGLLLESGSILDIEGSPTTIPPNLDLAVFRLHAGTESVFAFTRKAIHLYPLGSNTAAFSAQHSYAWNDAEVMETGGRHPHAAMRVAPGLPNSRPLMVYACPDPPSSPRLYPENDLFHSAPDVDLSLDHQALLANDRFPAGLQPKIILATAPQNGELIGSAVGEALANPMVYRPDPGFTGTDTFHYRLQADGPTSEDDAIVQLRIESVPSHNEVLPVNEPRDIAFDPVRDILYIATSAGVARYSARENRFLETLAPDESFSRLDVNPEHNQLFAARLHLPQMRMWNLDQPDDSRIIELPEGYWVVDVAVFSPDRGIISAQESFNTQNLKVGFYLFPTAEPEDLTRFDFESLQICSIATDRVGGVAAVSGRIFESESSWWKIPIIPKTAAVDQKKDIFVAEGRVHFLNGALLGPIRDLSPSPGVSEIGMYGGMLLHPKMNLLVVLDPNADQLVVFDTRSWEILEKSDLPFDAQAYDLRWENGSEMALDSARNRVYLTHSVFPTHSDGVVTVPLFGETPITVSFLAVNDPDAIISPSETQEMVAPNTGMQIAASPSEGHEFDHWSVTPDTAGYALDPTAAETEVIMLRSGTVEAHFRDGNQTCVPIFKVNDPRWGNAGPVEPWDTPLLPGSTIEIGAQPVEGMTFLGWTTTEDGLIDDPAAQTTLLNVQGNPIVTAFFGPEIVYGRYPSRRYSLSGIELSDFNGDGYLEGISPSSSRRGLSFWDSDFGGGLLPNPGGVEFSIDFNISMLRVNDFNQDNHDDVVIAFNNDTFGFWSNPGLGGYPPSYQSFQIQPCAGDRKFLIGDFSGDGYDDLYFFRDSSTGLCAIHRFLGNGFDEGTVVSPSLSYPSAADFNGDGLLDLVGSTSDDLLVLINRGNLNFELVEQIPFRGIYSKSLDIGDIDGDPYPDFLFTYEKTVIVFLGNGDGTFRRSPQSMPYPIQAAKIVDMEGNGTSDVLLMDNNSLLRIMLNDGYGHFCDRGKTFGYMDEILGRTQQVDFDRDGDLDLLAGGMIWLFDSLRTFEVDPGRVVNSYPAGTVIGTIKASISDHEGPYTYELLPEYSEPAIEHFEQIGDQLILKAEYEPQSREDIFLYFRISNGEGIVGSAYFNPLHEQAPEEPVPLGRPVGASIRTTVSSGDLYRYKHGLSITNPEFEEPVTYRFVSGIGDRDNGRFTLEISDFDGWRDQFGRMLFELSPFPPRWFSFRVAAEAVDQQPPATVEAIIQFLEATRNGGPYTFDVYHLLNLAAITRLEISEAPEFGSAEVMGDSIVYTAPIDITQGSDTFYYIAEDDDGNQHTVQAVISLGHDIDMDGLLDAYEAEYFGTSYTRWDTDLDGFDDGLEYLTGSDPRDAGKWFRIEKMEANEDSVSITFTGSTERRYSIQELRAEEGWTTIPGCDRIHGAAPDPTQVSIPVSSGDVGFFRVVVHREE